MADVKVVRHHRTSAKPERRPLKSSPAPHTPVSICAVATSTGGPPALQKIFSGLPANFPVPILVVQHIASGFTDGLANWLDSSLALTVKVAEIGERLRPSTIYLAREDYHLGVARDGTALLSRAAAIEGFRPSATFLFRSVAEVYGNRTLALILTGMGRDGVEGLRAVRQAGGTIFAQDEASCVVYGMPGAAVAEELVDQILPLDRLTKALLARTASE
jgi:two-component system chemotaxis response regulator CheB